MLICAIRNILVIFAAFVTFGCSSAGKYRENADQAAYSIIETKQMEALGRTEPFTIERPEDTLRRRLMIEQNLPRSTPASLSARDMETIGRWPDEDYLRADAELGASTAAIEWPTMQLTLMDALQIAALNSRQYQTAKENVYRAALSLDLERDQYRLTFSGALDENVSADLGGDETVSGSETSALAGVTKQFLNGMSLTARIGFDLAKMLNPFSQSSQSLFADASVAIPLLRGAGRHIAAEPLTQAERNALYAIYDFEEFKRSFVTGIASEYLSVLQTIDQIVNAENNYEGLITSTRLMRRQADAGKRTQVEVDQSIQQELSARNNWISARFRYESRLDSLKITLGLPPDAEIQLDRDELERLTESARGVITASVSSQIEETVPPADAPVTLRPSTMEGAGPLELDEEPAIDAALENRLDLRAAIGEVFDAQRRVMVAADALRPELTLLGSAGVGEGRGLGASGRPDNMDLDVEKGRYNALLTLDPPFERTREMVSYRNAIISMEQAVRNLQNLEDSIKLDVRNRLRDLREARESLRIQAQAVDLAERRVRSTTLSLQAGRVISRDVLEAQSDLLASQNSLTSAMVNYRVAEWQLQRDLGVLLVDEKGIWTEYSPTETNDERDTE